MLAALPRACAQLDAHPAVRVVVLRGGGDRAFVSGGDLREMHARSREPAPAADRLFAGVGAHHLLALDRPVIAMLRGWCLGGGVLVALCADLRVAADDVRMGVPAARLGLAYPVEAVAMLEHLTGPSATARILFTGERLDAAEALRIGLVDQVVGAPELERAVRDLAAPMVENAPLSLRAAKRAIRAVTGTGDLTTAQEAIAEAWASDDAREGPRAFAERRRPDFSGS